ncbi:MAG: hypothetical protein HOB51_04185 [Thaumarchaeota archaeon]|nr:hypothetical protein [Nitrososphaerota archaeon]
MNDQELVDAVRELATGTDNQIPIPVKSLREKYFLHQPRYSELRNAFDTSSFVKGDAWNWHQFVDMVMEPPEKRQDMYQRTISLLSDFGNNEKYFVLRTDTGLYHVPNALSDLNRLKIISEEYFEIYKNIMKKIHFDHPAEKQIGRIKGKINWGETIKISNGNFPINFVTSLSKKNFKTPENILLVLCAYWMLKESDKILKTDFIIPLTERSRKTLSDISKKSKFILEKFPFDEVLDLSKQFWDFEYEPPSDEIKNLELKTKKRILQGTIKNPHYVKLLKWIQKFRDLGIKSLDKQSPTQNILDSLKNIDTIYEIWIFMEFITYLNERELLLDFELLDNPHCTFVHRDMEIKFQFGGNFYPSDGLVWAKHHSPDFIATTNSYLNHDVVLGVFDAKNYSKGEDVGGTHDKMLAYLNNFDTNFGALIYPNHPEDWDRQTEPENETDEQLEKRQRNILEKSVFQTHLPKYLKDEKKLIRKKTLLTPWDDLEDEYKELIPRWSQVNTQNNSGKKYRFHRDQTLSYLKMNPELTVHSIDAKNKTLDYIFNTIVSGADDVFHNRGKITP